MRTLKSIRFTFDNCEQIEIEAKYFGWLCIDDIRTRIDRIACNAISEMDIAHKVHIEIFKEGNNEYSCFGEAEKKFDRILRCDDITCLELEFTDGTEREIYVDYREDRCGINEIQITKLSSLGNLYIVIEDSGTFEDTFPEDYIEDIDFVESRKDVKLEYE